MFYSFLSCKFHIYDYFIVATNERFKNKAIMFIIMKGYSNNLRIGVLMSRGIVNSDVLKRPTNIDEVIHGIASAILPKAENVAFSLAFGTLQSWDEVSDRYNSELQRNVTAKTARDYAMRALRKIKETAGDDEKLRKIDENLYQKAQRLYEEFGPSA